jgi:hypothetical protein
MGVIIRVLVTAEELEASDSRPSAPAALSRE